MSRGTRRGLLWRCSAAAVMAFAAVAAGGPAAAQVVADFNPPQSNLLLTRTLTVSLPDGKTITTRRSYEVRIVRDASGFQVDGRLVEVLVDAPPSLQVLAEIERKRPDTGMFPFRLDRQGMIASAMAQDQNPAVGQAAVVLSERIGGSGLAALDMLQAQAFIARLRQGGSRSVWPLDVFRPMPGKRSEARTIALPGGNEGQVTIEIEGQGPGPAGQMAALDRVVTTSLSGDRRMTREHWQVSRYPANFER